MTMSTVAATTVSPGHPSVLTTVPMFALDTDAVMTVTMGDVCGSAIKLMMSADMIAIAAIVSLTPSRPYAPIPQYAARSLTFASRTLAQRSWPLWSSAQSHIIDAGSPL